MGFCLGVANIIPGVSGGTFLLVFGIYERVFSILNQINKGFILQSGRLVKAMGKSMGTRGTARELICFFRETGFLFLLKLGVGAVIAILGLSGLMKFLLVNHFSITYALFFGLILISVIIPVRMLKRFDAGTVFWLLLGAVLTVAVTWMVNPYDKIKMKSDYLEQEYSVALETGQTGKLEKETATDSPSFRFTGRYSPAEYLYIGLCGALAISATVLPGISGSLVLILMGSYFDVISAISALRTLNLDTMAFLGIFSLGVGFGGLLFARLVSFVLSRYYNVTMAFLIGLMVGSLYALWPFKQTIVMARQYVQQAGQVIALENVVVQTNINILPGKDDPVLSALLFFIVGCVIMLGFIRIESSKE